MLLNIFVIAWLGIPSEHIPQIFREKQTDLGNVNASLCGHCKTGQPFFSTGNKACGCLRQKNRSPNMFSPCFYDCFRLVKIYVDIGSRVLAWGLGGVCVWFCFFFKLANIVQAGLGGSK